jgi:hypothetical protein
LDSKSSFEAKLGREPGSGKRKTKGNSEFPGTGTRVGVGIIQREVNGCGSIFRGGCRWVIAEWEMVDLFHVITTTKKIPTQKSLFTIILLQSRMAHQTSAIISYTDIYSII